MKGRAPFSNAVIGIALLITTCPLQAGAQVPSSTFGSPVVVGTSRQTATAGTSLDLGSVTDSMLLPKGTTGQEPTGVAGMIRYNSTNSAVEFYNGSSWISTGGGSSTFTAGSVSSPGLAVQGDTTTGFFQATTGTLSVATEGVEAVRFLRTASAVDYLTLTGASAGNGPTLASAGSDTNVDLNISSQGTGAINFNTGGNPQLKVANFAGATDYLQVSGGNSSNAVVAQATGSDTNVSLWLSSKGTGGVFYMSASGLIQAKITPATTAANYLDISAGNTGTPPILAALGSDTNINLIFLSQGTGSLDFRTNGAGGNGGTHQVYVLNTASAVDQLTLTGGAAGNPGTVTIATLGTDTNINIALTPKGSGYVSVTDNGTYVINASNTATSGTVYGVYSTNASTGTGTGVYGLVNGASNTGYGVYGYNQDPSNGGSGVRGDNASTGTAYGVYGRITGAGNTGYGVYGYDSDTANIGYGVVGANSTTLAGRGVYGTISGAANTGYGVYGLDSDTANSGYGVYGKNQSTLSAYGVYGIVTGANNSGKGVSGLNTDANNTGYGVYGSNASTGAAYGVYGTITGANNNGYGVYGGNTDTNNSGYGVFGYNASTGAANGMYGQIAGAANSGYGVTGLNSGVGNAGSGVFGNNSSATGSGTGVIGQTASTGSGKGVYGKINGASNTGYGVYGFNSDANNTGYGVYGINTSTVAGYGVYGSETGASNTGYAIYGLNNSATGWGEYQAGTAPNYFNGKVGIGSTTPGAPLDVNAGTVTTSVPAFSIEQTWNAAGVNFDAPLLMNVTNTASGGSSNLMDLQVGGSSKFSIGKSGQITGTSDLTVSGHVIAANNKNVQWNGRGILSSPAAGAIQLGAADAAAPVAQTLGVQNVAVGTTDTAGADFTIAGSQGTGTGGGGKILFKTAPASGSSLSTPNALVTAMTITSAGNVGIGTTGPAYLLHVGSASASGVVAEFQNSAGACTFTPSASSMVASCSSDMRLKSDVEDAGDALAWLGDMRIRDFTIKSTGQRKTGVIAQEMLKAHPDMVHMGEDSFYKVDEPDPWKLIRAIQELKVYNDELKAANDNLDARVRLLEAAQY